MSTGSPAPVGFDIDLTLVDSGPRIIACAVAAFADVGAHVDPAEIRPMLGLTLAEKAARLAPEADAEEFIRAYRVRYLRPDAPSAPAMPGAREAIAAVRAAGARVVVVSAKVDRLATQALAEAGLLDVVDAVHGSLFGVQKSLALLAEDAGYYVGDHPADMVAATEADAIGVGVATGVFDAPALFTAGATDVLTSLLAFPDWYARFGHLGG